MWAVPLATRCCAEFDLTLGIVFNRVKTCINLLLTRITTSEISKIKVNNQKPAPFHGVGIWARFCGGEQHGSVVGSSVAFSSYKRKEIKDELLGCVLFSLLWTGCNPSVLEEWKVCGVQKVERASLLSPHPPPAPPQSRECDTAGGNHMLSEDFFKAFCPLGCAVSSCTPDKSRRNDYAAQWANKTERKKNHENCWTNKLPFSVSGHLLLLSLHSHLSMHRFLRTNVSNTVAREQLKGDCFPPQWAPSLLPKVNMNSALISIVP